MAYRRKRRSKSDVHPTYEKIVEHATAVLIEDGFDGFSAQRLVDSAQVSRATLYHHFTDLDAVIEAALAEIFRQEVNHTHDAVTELMDRSADRATFREGLRAVAQQLSEVPTAVRVRRAHIIALAAARPQFAAVISDAQDTLTDSWDTTLQEAQRRGFLRADLDTRFTAVMTQAMTIGRIVDDAASTQLDNQRWARGFFDIIDRAFLDTDT